jgi:hypothetical protein
VTDVERGRQNEAIGRSQKFTSVNNGPLFYSKAFLIFHKSSNKRAEEESRLEWKEDSCVPENTYTSKCD